MILDLFCNYFNVFVNKVYWKITSKEKFSKTDVNSTLGRFENQQIVDMSF